jgi:hypothetical protein
MAASDVGSRYDLWLDGQGYVFADLEHDKALYGYTPTFVSRTNVQGDYGDNQQDFWLTWTQRDWSGGEQAKYETRGNDPQNRYWLGAAVDARIPGEVSMRKASTGLTFAAAPKTATGDAANDLVWVSTATTLYTVDYAGTIVSIGAHGLGAAPSRWGQTTQAGTFISTTTAGTVGVRVWNGATFSTFSATSADSLAYLANALYGFRESAGTLVRYDTAGVASILYTWQSPSGGAITGLRSKLVPFGGKLLILREKYPPRGSELWLYDGTAPAKIAEFPANFKAYDCEVSNGVVYVSGAFEKHVSANIFQRPAIIFYKDGAQDILWQTPDYLASSIVNSPALASFDNGLIWTDAYNGNLVYYDFSTGGFTSIAVFAPSGNELLSSTGSFLVQATVQGTAGKLYPASSDAAESAATVSHSLIDFDTSLRKIFRSVKVEFDAAPDGNGGSVDIAYRFNDLAVFTFTTLHAGITSGTEYFFPEVAEGTTYQSVSIKITLNKDSSSNGPKLKRVSVRGLPVLPAYKKRTYVLLLGGRDGDSPVKLRDNTLHPLDGKDMATNLQTATGRTSPFSITDSLDTFTGRVEEDGLQMVEYKPQQWIAKISVREV